ncbi:MAG: hypothetical protein JKY20_00345 [Alphaproteobacteria bacterium]|nr:hypothetical protein [Alphaproteobacteria bacterium]
MSDKPVIVLYGNCHVGFARNVLARLDALSDSYEIWWVRNFAVNNSLKSGFDLDKLRNCEFFIQQGGHWDTDSFTGWAALKDLLPANCRIIRAPPLFLNTLWPFMIEDPRNRPDDLNPEGAYPSALANRAILKLMRDETDPEQVFARYRDKDITDLVNIDRLHSINMAQLHAMDDDADIALAPFIEQNFAKQRLFLSHLHPTGVLCAEIARQIVAALGLVDANDPQLQETLNEVEAVHGVGGFDAPIHPGIVEHFGLEWARDLRYRYYDEGYFDHDEFLKRYIRFKSVPEYFAAKALINSANWAQAEKYLRVSIGKSPRSARFHGCLGETLFKLGRLEEAEKTYSMAVAYDKDDDKGGFYIGLARAQLPMDSASALQSIDAALELQPDNLEARELRLKICVTLGETSAIVSAESDAARARDIAHWPPFLEKTGAIHGRYWLPEGGSGF